VDLITKLTAIFNNPLQLFPEKDTSNEVELMKKNNYSTGEENRRIGRKG
jgi:hypothetical protein